ncbi:recombinase family protein [Clostridium sp. YIM B02555]|uniref:recombinase family protein n=1 Tax=Clostridium sp. YIM B02555 TaxID=2911968 RepID=UPI001EEDD782|nr:recombinase family protein [Clostridium sp. YIM B02555]
MNKIYGYCRISTNKQSIERQHRNILAEYPNVIIIDEAFTGTKIEGRKEFNKLLSKISEGDTIVFDSVSRMSRNAEEGYKLYEELFNKGIELIFLREQHINTSTYKKALTNNVEMTGTNVDFILDGINKYLLALAKEQIKLAFIQSEKEVADLHQRTKEGIETARLNGKQIGQKKGIKLTTKKSIEAKEQILKYSKDFQGLLNDVETMKLTGLARNTYYKYKKELFRKLESEVK